MSQGEDFLDGNYLARAGVPRELADLASHQCLRILRRAEDKTRWSLIRDNQQVDVVVRGRFVGNNIRILQQLASLGMGIAMLAVTLAGPEVEAGRLVQVLQIGTRHRYRSTR